MRGSICRALRDIQSLTSVPYLAKGARPQESSSKDLSRVEMGWAQAPFGSPCRVGPADSRSEMITYFSNNLQKKNTERESTMRRAINPFSNRQAPKRNHEKVNYQNELNPFPKLLFHFGSPPSPIFPCSLISGLFLAFPLFIPFSNLAPD